MGKKPGHHQRTASPQRWRPDATRDPSFCHNGGQLCSPSLTQVASGSRSDCALKCPVYWLKGGQREEERGGAGWSEWEAREKRAGCHGPPQGPPSGFSGKAALWGRSQGSEEEVSYRKAAQCWLSNQPEDSSHAKSSKAPRYALVKMVKFCLRAWSSPRLGLNLSHGESSWIHCLSFFESETGTARCTFLGVIVRVQSPT